MIAIIYDRLIKRYKWFLLYALISAAAIAIAATQKPTFPIYLYILFCFYWNGIFKTIGTGVHWKLAWSLPLSDRGILVGTAISQLLLGWSMNLLLYLDLRIWMPLPWQILLLSCIVSLFTDLFIMGMEFLKDSRIKAIAVVAWMVVIYALPLVLKGNILEKAVQVYLEWPLFQKILPFLFIYLIGLAVIRHLYKYFKRTYEMSQA